MIDTINKAKARRNIDQPLIIHSDRGSQYVAKEYIKATEHMKRSYSKKAFPWDNACIESFHSIIKREWLNRFKIRDHKQAYRLIFEYLEAFYNTKRIHSHCDYMSPDEFERVYERTHTEAELLAVILRTGTKDTSAVELAEKVLTLAKYPREGLLGLHDVSVEELTQIRGIGIVKAVKLKCIAELSNRMSRARASTGICFTRADMVAEYFMEKLRHKDTECVYLLCLDAKGQLIREKKLSDGCVNMALISPREIFLEALKDKAVNIILVHNHPSGDPTPSRADRELTDNVAGAGEQMDIPLLDHIIIGDNRYTSFKEQKLLR